MNFLRIVSLLLIILGFMFLHSQFVAYVKSRSKSKHQTPEKRFDSAKTGSMEHVTKALENALDKDIHQNLKHRDLQLIVLDAVFWKACLPKIVCELNAADPYQSTSSWEKLTNMRSTLSSGPTSELHDRFHFAATMGYLFYNVDGTGCHNVYPECPFTRDQLMVTSQYIMIQ